MKRTFLFIAAASLCLLAAAGCSADTEQPDNVPTPPSQESAEQPPEPATDTTEPTEEAPAPDDAVSADLSAEPPYLHVTYGGEALDVRGWNWEWTVQSPDGTTQTLTPQWATAYPLDWVDMMDTLLRSEEQTLLLSFAVEPDTVTAYADALSGETSIGSVPVENGTELSLPDDTEGIVYTIHAEWNGSGGYQGTSNYAFCVKST